MKMPILFIGHGSPMNAIAKNKYTETLNELSAKIPKPKAVLCISAHWMTELTWITHMARPKTIHDFGGFPEELFAVQYPAPGAPEIAEHIARTVLDPNIRLDDEMWGFDHGAWSVLRHLYPNADIPVLQLSLHLQQPGPYHFKLGTQLQALREQEILILGSGNIVHNLRQIKWDERAEPYPWAIEFDRWFKDRAEEKDFTSLIDPLTTGGASARLSIPTWEHYYPLLYILGAASADEKLKWEYESLDNGSISMRSLSFGM